MEPLAQRFLLIAAVCAFAGTCLGLLIGVSGNHTLAPVHAHIALLGWVSMALFGLFYQCVPGAADGYLPRAHFWTFSLGTNLFIPSLAASLFGYTFMLPVLVLASCLSAAGMMLFGAVVFRARKRDSNDIVYAPDMALAGRRTWSGYHRVNSLLPKRVALPADMAWSAPSGDPAES